MVFFPDCKNKSSNILKESGVLKRRETDTIYGFKCPGARNLTQFSHISGRDSHN